MVEITLAITVLLLAALTFFATVDMAFSQLSDVGLRRIATDAAELNKTGTANFLHEILENRPRFRFALSAVIQVLLVAVTVLLVLLTSFLYPAPPDILFFSLPAALVISVFFRQILPRVFTGRNPESRLLLFLPPVRPLYRLWSFVARPFALFFPDKEQQKLDLTVTADDQNDAEDSDAEDIQALIEIGKAEGIIEEDDRELIEKLFEFGDTEVDEIMTPRTAIVALPIDSTVENARDLIVEQKYSRLPVYRDNIDNIEGLIYVRDLLQMWADGRADAPIKPLLRPAYFIPETKSAAELLKSMQLNHVQIAIVVDEYGGVAGLVTVEDILEEIVGEIEDEDSEEEEIIEIMEGMNGYWDVLGSTEIGKIERLFKLEIADDDFSTIAGLVTSEAGYVPKVGEILSFHGLELEILRADEKKIYLIRIRPASDAENTAVSGETV